MLDLSSGLVITKSLILESVVIYHNIFNTAAHRLQGLSLLPIQVAASED